MIEAELGLKAESEALLESEESYDMVKINMTEAEASLSLFLNEFFNYWLIPSAYAYDSIHHVFTGSYM